MRVLVADIGNTDIKFGLFQQGRLQRQWRLPGFRIQAPDGGIVLKETVAQTGADIDALVYSSVVPEIEALLRKVAQDALALPLSRIFDIHPGNCHLPVDFSAYAAGQLGMDRLVNACGAALLYPGVNLIVVDFGTATTFDIVDASRRYRGGAIAPGLMIFANLLPEKTARLPHVSLSGKSVDTIGMGANTVECLEAGLALGYRGLLKELLETAIGTLHAKETGVIATGGLAESAIHLCGLETRFDHVEPMLTLNGLYSLYTLNQ